MLQKKILKKKSLEIIIQNLETINVNDYFKGIEISKGSREAIEMIIGDRIDKFKAELSKLKSVFDGKENTKE